MQPPADPSLYDAVPYPGHAFAQTHPDRLALLGALFGLDAAPPAACRVLEIGCGDGGNLLPMALALPGSSFVGIDPSARAIARAEEITRELELPNVRFEEVGAQDFQTPAGSFDYAIAHGVFSWVPDAVRVALLALCAHALQPNGIAFVSYNALPGARVPQTLRELLTIKLEGIEAPASRIAEARRVLGLLSGPDGKATALGAEAAALLDRPDELLFHDVLAPVSDPFLFSEFAARAADHGLQYLAEANLLEMQVAGVPPQLARELLADEDVVRQEQVLDYLRLRRFRQTLLCHADAHVDRMPNVAAIARFAVSSPARWTVENAARPGRVTFWAPGGARMTTEDAVVADVIKRAAGRWPAAVSVIDLAGGDDMPQLLPAICGALLTLYATTNLVQLHAHPPMPATTAGERPLAGPLARIQARDQPEVANLRHATVPLDDGLLRRLLVLLDGTRDREALLAELGGVDADTLKAGLQRLARSSLLVA